MSLCFFFFWVTNNVRTSPQLWALLEFAIKVCQKKLLFYFAHTSVWNLGSVCVCSRLVCCYCSWEGADRSLLAQVWDSVWTTLGICENTLKSKVSCLQHYLNTSFDRDHIVLDMENYSEYLLTSNDVALILWNGEKLHGEVLVWSSRQHNKVFSLFTRRISYPLEILSLTSLEYMQMLKYSITKCLSL